MMWLMLMTFSILQQLSLVVYPMHGWPGFNTIHPELFFVMRPDLYIPVMSYVTYVLIYGLSLARRSHNEEKWQVVEVDLADVSTISNQHSNVSSRCFSKNYPKCFILQASFKKTLHTYQNLFQPQTEPTITAVLIPQNHLFVAFCSSFEVTSQNIGIFKLQKRLCGCVSRLVAEQISSMFF